MHLKTRPLPRALLRHLIGRGMLLWGLTRATTGGLVFVNGGSVIAIGVGATLWTLLLGVTLGLIESRRSREDALLANLAFSPALHLALLLLAGAVGEVTLRVFARQF